MRDLPPDVARKYANETITGSWTFSSTAPTLKWNETDAGTNLKNWDIVANSGHFSIRALSDAGALSFTALDIARSGGLSGTIVSFGTAQAHCASVSAAGTATDPNFVMDATGLAAYSQNPIVAYSSNLGSGGGEFLGFVHDGSHGQLLCSLGGIVSDSALTVPGLTVDANVSADAGGLKHKRVTTGSIAAGSTALVTVTWGTAFADANYTVSASVVEATTSSLSLSVVHVESVSASQVKVRVLNNALGALTGTLHVMALHD